MSGSHIIQTTPEIFSPDGDGYDDHIIFSYQLPEPGYTGNLRIYDAAGNLVKHLLRNELLGTTGSFGWNGITDNGQKAPMGIYLYCFEAFNLKGDVLQRKSTLVVAAKLE
jgi:flagellar hook assembly protein FlgD